MGLKGLLWYCKSHSDDCVVTHDLVAVAQHRGEIEILVDFYCFKFFIHRQFAKYLKAVADNDYLIIIGAESNVLERYVTSFIQKLSAVNIKLVWFVDCERGGDRSQHEQKFDKWKKEYIQRIRCINDTMDICNGSSDVSSITEMRNICPPVLWDMTLLQIIVKNSCEVIHCPSSDSDCTIAMAIHERPKAYAIFSNDTDFAIFANTPYIADEFMDLEEDVGFTKSDMCDPEQRSLGKLLVGIITAEQVSRSFNFPSPELMIDLSIIRGNNFSFHSVEGSKLHEVLGCSGENILQQLARVLSESGSIDKNNHLAYFKKSREFCDAIQQSYDHYKLKIPRKTDVTTTRNALSRVIVEQIESNAFPPVILAMHNAVYWRRLIAETDLDHREWQSIEMLLLPLRRYIYAMCLPCERRNEVTFEYGRDVQSDRQDLFRACKIEKDKKMKLQTINAINKESKEKNLHLFTKIMGHMLSDNTGSFRCIALLTDLREELKKARARNRSSEDPFSADYNPDHVADDTGIRRDDYIKIYGEFNGFKLVILRYFLLLNWKRYLNISPQNFLALVAVVMREADDEKYQKFAQCPDAYVVTLANWFLNVYRHAYDLLGSILYIRDYFPQPKDIFCGSAWLAFYTCTNADENDDNPILMEANSEMVSVLQNYRDEVILLTCDHFSFPETLIEITKDRYADIGF